MRGPDRGIVAARPEYGPKLEPGLTLSLPLSCAAGQAVGPTIDAVRVRLHMV